MCFFFGVAKMISFRVDRIWMYNRLLPSRKGLNEDFIKGVDEFVAFAITQEDFVSNYKIRCPCSRCQNMKFLNLDDVKIHLYKYGFVPDYYQWISHMTKEIKQMLEEHLEIHIKLWF